MSDTLNATTGPDQSIGQEETAGGVGSSSSLRGPQWLIGHRPRDDAEWQMEWQAINNAWWQDISAQQSRTFSIGKIPETDYERDLELKLRSLDRWAEVAQNERLRRADMDADASKINYQAERIRGYVVMGIVAALIGAPVLAMLLGVAPEDFGQFIAPVTGVAGTVIGYWFGRSGTMPIASGSFPEPAIVNPSMPNTAASAPTDAGLRPLPVAGPQTT